MVEATSEIRRRSSLFAISRQEIAATSQVDHSDAPVDHVCHSFCFQLIAERVFEDLAHHMKIHSR
jgi:hypothetical protein